jgi:hypothetical protein
MPEILKLADLRTKTDRQLRQLIDHRLNAGLECALDGRVTDSEDAYVEARRLLALLRKTSAMEVGSQVSKLNRLRRLLDALPAPCLRAACF